MVKATVREAILKQVSKEVAAWPWWMRPESTRQEIAALHKAQGKINCRCNCCAKDDK